MKVEHFPGFICTIDESTGTITAAVIPWENCEYVPEVSSRMNYSSEKNRAAVGRDYDDARHFPFPVKFIPRPQQSFLPRTFLAVRTDVYPLLWIYVWLHLHIENMFNRIWCSFMFCCNRLGLAKTPPGNYCSLRDFKVDKFLVIQFIANIICTLGAVSLFKAGQPILGGLWFLWWFLQYLILKKRDKRRKLIEQLKELDRVALARVRAMPQKVTQINLLGEDCQRCKYYYGHYSIVCAVHPSGYDGDYCKDRSTTIG